MRLHATDPISVYLAPRARIDGFEVAELESALYERMTAIRTLGMRRTMFVLPPELAPVVHQACTAKVAAANRRRLVRLIEDNHLAHDGTRWLADTEQAVLAALVERGDALAGELSTAVPAPRAKVGMAVGKPYGAEVALTNQVLTNLAAQGRIVRGRPRGRWTSTQYRWALIERWTSEAPDEAEAAALAAWLGDVWFKPKYRTPLERQLAG
ncbi:MAG: DNA glycosylase AlkZ-like family protein [Acidimicrobiales bacterium]